MKIENNKECFVRLWLMLERTRRLLREQHKRFCIRNVLKIWFGARANDDFIWEVCNRCNQEGWDEIPSFAEYPNASRDLLRAIVTVKLNIYKTYISLREFEKAYKIAFPQKEPIKKDKVKPILKKQKYGKSNYRIADPTVRAFYASRTLSDFD